MTFTAGSSGHLKAHNDLRAAVLTEAARFGLTPPNLAGPFVGGEPNHIGAHNDVAAAIRAIATAGGIDIDGNFSLMGQTFPDTAHLGDPGHPADHNLLWDAVELLRLSPAFNSVTGGTVQDLTDNGKRYRVHTFTATADITIGSAPKPFWVLLAGGGYDGGHGASGQYGGGGGGFYENKTATLPTGVVPVTVGAKNGGTTSIGTYSAEGAKGGNGVPGAGGGAGASNGGWGAEGPRSSIDGTDRGYCGGGSSVNWNYCCDPCCFGGNRNNSGGGAGHDCGGRDAWYYGGGGGRTQHTCGASGNGSPGVVIIRYEIV